MKTPHIYFEKFDELEAMLGQKRAERPSNARKAAAWIANRAWQWMHDAPPTPTRVYDTIRVTTANR